MERVRSAFKPTGKRPLVRPGLRWEDNIRINLKEIEELDIFGSG